jgi:hypothetical protein
MNYLKARQLKNADGTGGKWHYTSENDGNIHAIGYCAQGCPGHDTAEEACAHYRAYLLEQRARFDGALHGEQRPCAVCGAWTQGVVSIDGWHTYVLCDDHRTPEHLEKIYPPVGESWGS